MKCTAFQPIGYTVCFTNYAPKLVSLKKYLIQGVFLGYMLYVQKIDMLMVCNVN